MNKSQVSAILARDPYAVTKAIVLLFSYQTVGERRTSTTVEDNGVGFNAVHAKNASYWARWVLGVGLNTPAHIVDDKVRHYLTGDNCRQYRTLTGSYLVEARRVAAHYWRQLAAAAKAKAKAKLVPIVEHRGTDMSHMLRQFDRFQVHPGITQHV
jgi:hypothetical protein